jgi:hypothetical protein
MPTMVYELTGSMRHIEVGDDLVFPNVQTCIAVVAVVGGQMVGAHVTVADQGRMSKVAEEVQRRGTVTDLYVVGPISGTPGFDPYNVNSFANFGGTVHIYDTPGFIDVRAQMAGGGITFSKRPTGGHAWETIPLASFYP